MGLLGAYRASHETQDLFREMNSFFSGFAESRRQEVVTAPVSVGTSANNMYAEGARRENRADNQLQTGTEIGHSESEKPFSTQFL